MEGVDYSTGRPNLDVLRSVGKGFVVRYLAYLQNPKVLLPAELAALHAKGFGVVLNWEQAQGDMLRGFDTGATHAREALRQANALGAPSDTPIYFSCDVQITNGTQTVAVSRYLDGAASVLGRGRVGVYGQYSVIEALVPTVAPWGWQTYAWSGGRVSGKAHFLQYHNGVAVAGADCDLDRSLKPEFGAWYGGNMTALQSNDPAWINTHDRVYSLFADQVPKLLTAVSGLSGIGGLTADDRVAIKALTDAVNALNNRLSTP